MSSLYQHFKSCKRVITDSRKVEPGDMFFALKGPTFDGNAFAQKALEAGARYAVVDDPGLKGVPGMISVPEVLHALQDLARAHRRKFPYPVLAITGSNGKTTTKELVGAVLAKQFRVHMTRGNLNNHIGVPLTLLALPSEARIAVVEMGANHQGEIAELCRIAEPGHGLITNIGKAHLEGFGGVEGIKKGKGELYDWLAQHGGVAFVNADERFLPEMSLRVGRRIFYGRTSSEQYPVLPDYSLRLEKEDPHVVLSFPDESGKWISCEMNLMGVHNFQNAATAIAVGKYFKVPALAIAEALVDYVPANQRSQWISIGEIRVFMDAYNANPTSMRMALRSFVAATSGQSTVAILGDMFELGEATNAEHLSLAEFADRLPIDRVILVGQHFAAAADELGFEHYDSPEDLVEAGPKVFGHSAVMIKGSRGMRMERLLDAIKAN